MAKHQIPIAVDDIRKPAVISLGDFDFVFAFMNDILTASIDAFEHEDRTI